MEQKKKEKKKKRIDEIKEETDKIIKSTLSISTQEIIKLVKNSTKF
jgi:hypothetical protein